MRLKGSASLLPRAGYVVSARKASTVSFAFQAPNATGVMVR
jgi:hypothetical protein